MNIILGANGHVGSAVAKELLNIKEPVKVVLHNDEDMAKWGKLGAEVAIADVNDSDTLKSIFANGKRAFILNPPAAPSTNTVTVEEKSVASIIKALENSGIQKVVAESTYGAQPGEGIGDLGVLYQLEQGLIKSNIPVIIIRAAYYMSNWAASLKTAKEEGIIHTLYPVDFRLPMVSPDDIGKFAAQFLLESTKNTVVRYVEGPKEYSANDVANTFSVALNKPVKALSTPESQWLTALQQMGFSETAAKSMAAMTELTLQQKYNKPEMPYRGAITLQDYILEISK